MFNQFLLIFKTEESNIIIYTSCLSYSVECNDNDNILLWIIDTQWLEAKPIKNERIRENWLHELIELTSIYYK